MDNSIKSNDKVVLYDTLKFSQQQLPAFFDTDIHLLVELFESLRYDEADRIIERIFGLTDQANFSFQLAVSLYHSLMVMVYAHYEYRPDTDQFSSLHVKYFTQDLDACTSAEEAIGVIKNYIHEVFSDCINRKSSTKQDILVEQINAYLELHYPETSLSVAQIADNLFYESSYLRRIYKTATGKTIMNQLEAIRIARAQEMIALRKYKIGEIAKMVGYNNQFYFSRRFKMISGETPTEYETRFY